MIKNDKYELYNGDCLKVMDKLIEAGVKVDAVITDPPYGINFQSGQRTEKYKKIANDDDLSYLDEFFQKCDKLLKDNTHIYCFCSWHHIDKFKIAFEKYFKLKNIIVWDKHNSTMGDLKGAYAPKHEFILFGHNGRRLRNGKRFPDIIPAHATGNIYHPTQKPVDLLKIFIKQSTNKDELILDPFMGSGSTGVACMNTNRRFIGIELDEDYFNIAEERLKKSEPSGRQKHLF